LGGLGQRGQGAAQEVHRPLQARTHLGLPCIQVRCRDALGGEGRLRAGGQGHVEAAGQASEIAGFLGIRLGQGSGERLGAGARLLQVLQGAPIVLRQAGKGHGPCIPTLRNELLQHGQGGGLAASRLILHRAQEAGCAGEVRGAGEELGDLEFGVEAGGHATEQLQDRLLVEDH
jgi:hypothetical protein